VKLKIQLRDVWDWAYCPLRVWWRKTGLAPDVTDLHGKRTGEQLERESVKAAIKLYYKLAKNGKGYSFGQCLGVVWKKWLDGWGLEDEIKGSLVSYHQTRRALLKRFEAGEIRNRAGGKYKKPTWTRYYRQKADADGLTGLRKAIDGYQERIGLGRVDLSDDEYYQSPVGLADAFANSMDYANRLRLPDTEDVIDVDTELLADLPSVQLFCTADITIKKKLRRRRGRPRKDVEGPEIIVELEYVYLIFDEIVPSTYSLARDLRIIALGQALPVDIDFESNNPKVMSVRALHIPSGESQEFHPQLGDGAEMLESLSRAVIGGIRSGLYVPRMVCGWKACGECEYRALCFTESGVMDVFNPPLMAQIEAARLLRGKMKEFITKPSTDKSKKEILRSFLEFQAKTPGMTPEGALWMLDNLEAELG